MRRGCSERSISPDTSTRVKWCGVPGVERYLLWPRGAVALAFALDAGERRQLGHPGVVFGFNLGMGFSGTAMLAVPPRCGALGVCAAGVDVATCAWAPPRLHRPCTASRGCTVLVVFFASIVSSSNKSSAQLLLLNPMTSRHDWALLLGQAADEAAFHHAVRLGGRNLWAPGSLSHCFALSFFWHILRLG